MKKHIIAYRVLETLGFGLFLIGLVNLALDYQLDGFQLVSILLATGGLTLTVFASIMVDACKIRAKTALLIEHERKHKEALYKPNLLPMDLVYNEESMPENYPSHFLGPNWGQMLSDYKINTAVARTNEEIDEWLEKDLQHHVRLIRKGTKGFTE